MRTSTYRASDLGESYGIGTCGVDMGPAGQLGVGAAWARVPPGGRSMANQHDEIETWVILAGGGEAVVDAARHPVRAGMVVQFDPFETHFVENTGDADLVFASFFWRDGDRALRLAGCADRRRFGERPVFVFSSAPTPNGDLHLGHLSGPFFAADVFVRYQRMTGARAWHLTGSDDFQSYVVAAARREGREPAETAEHYSREILGTLRLMDIEVHQYTATSREPSYPDGLRAFFSRLVASGAAAPRECPALLDGETGRYLFEAGVAGGCPSCGSECGGNLCETCREPNLCHDLVEPRATASGARPRVGTVTQFTLPVLGHREDVVAHHRLGRVPASVRELAGRVFRRERLDVPLTHPAEWGVPPAEPGADGQVIWSWIDVAYNFLHSIERLGRGLDAGWKAGAPEADWKIVHFLGSDGSFFHPILHPVLYRLAYPDWNPDIDYHLNEFYELEGSKFSTSRRHVIWGKDVLGPHTVDAFRFYLALTRPEGRRTSFDRAGYEACVRDTLAGTWQRWLNDLGARVEARHGGVAPDAGLWTPEQTAFLARLGTRLAALTGSLGPDAFSLNRAAAELRGLVDDVTAFARAQAPLAEIESWKDEARTAIALELAAARLLAACGAPVMPRFAARLAAAIGEPPPAEWPRRVELVKPGTRIDLARQVFFGGAPEPALLPWLSGLVRDVLRLPPEAPVRDRTLVGLGMESLQAIALQYQILDQVGADVSIEDLLGQRDVAELASFIAADVEPEVVTARAEEMPA